MSEDIDTGGRGQSSIQFPYADLADAIEVANGLHKGGGVPLGRDQLAAVMQQAPGSGSFNTKLGAARIFGLMETSQGKYQLTPLGFEVLDPTRASRAKAEAFLRVPLYRTVFDQFRGKQLPPRPLGLETAFVSFGVAPKQKERARQIFDRSARIAGFFPNGQEDRIVEPIIGLPTIIPSDEPSRPTGSGDGAVRMEPDDGVDWTKYAPRSAIHPSIQGMLDELPPPKTEWSKSDQADWLQAVAQVFRVIYKKPETAEGEITVTVRKPGTQ